MSDNRQIKQFRKFYSISICRIKPGGTLVQWVALLPYSPRAPVFNQVLRFPSNVQKHEAM